MSAVTTHVLDTAKGRPAAGIAVRLLVKQEAGWRELARGETDADGRLRTLLATEAPLAIGTYRLTFDTGAYLVRTGAPVFYPEVTVTFEVDEEGGHYHVPLLLSPYGYSTYRGS